MVRNLLRILIGCSAVGALVGAGSSQVTAKVPSFSIQILAPQAVVKVGSDVRLKIVFTNNTSQPLHYATGAPGRGTGPSFDIDLRDSDGKRIPETPYGLKTQGKAPHRPFVGSVFAATVQPGGTLVREVLLSKEYEISKSGKYTVEVTERNPNPERGESNTITLTVVQ
jgi:hypothetical protein